MECGYYILVSFVILFRVSDAAFDNRGTEFIVGFMDNLVYRVKDYKPELFITTSKSGPVHVNVSAPNAGQINIDQSFTVTSGQVHYIQLNPHIRLHHTEMSSKGILIQSDNEIVVYGVNREEYSDDGYLALPTDVLGTEYYTASYSPKHYTLFLVIGVTDNTQVSIRLANNQGVTVTYNQHTYHGGEWVNVTMNRLDTFEIHSTGDLTGSYIKANNPVSVFSGNKKTTVGTSGSSDHLVEHLPPLQSWGKHFATVPIPDRTVGDIFRFVASEDHTNVTVAGEIGTKSFHDTFIIKTAGTYVQKHYDSRLYSSITTNKPILLLQYSITQSHSHTDHADPSMIIIPPVEQYAADYTFTTPKYSHGNYTNYFVFVVKGSEKAGLRLDGNPLPLNTYYKNIPGTNLVGGYVKISPGTHSVSHTTPTSVIGGILFGKANHESYGFPVGLLLAPINSGCKTRPMTEGDEIDNDCDGNIDEENCNGIDDDDDGRIDEDCHISESVIIG